MRMIGLIETEQGAATFSDYLLTRKIDAHVEEGGDGRWQVWVEHDDAVDAARQELDLFSVNPADPRFEAATNASAIRRDLDKSAEKRQRKFTDVRTAWSGATRGRQTTATLLLIAASVISAFMTNFGKNESGPLFAALFDDPRAAITLDEQRNEIIEPGHTMFSSITHGQIWRLVTPIFVHFGVIHLLFNMMWMWQLGPMIESRKGTLYLLGLVLVIAVVSNCAEASWAMFLHGNAHWILFGGMSGVVGGLLGYSWMKGQFEPWDGIGIPLQTVAFMLGWFVVCSLGLIGNIANAAHWAGLIAGMGFVLIPRALRRKR